MAIRARATSSKVPHNVAAYVYSTMTASQEYAEYDPENLKDVRAATHVITQSVFIKGGAGVARRSLITPLGVMTEVDDQQLALLKRNSHFNKHVADGWLKVVETKTDVEAVVGDLNQRDQSSPLVPADYGDAKPPVTSMKQMDAQEPTSMPRHQPLPMPKSPFR